MTEQQPWSQPRLKTGFCRHCLRDRYKDEMVIVTTKRGGKVQRCVHCAHLAESKQGRKP